MSVLRQRPNSGLGAEARRQAAEGVMDPPDRVDCLALNGRGPTPRGLELTVNDEVTCHG